MDFFISLVFLALANAPELPFIRIEDHNGMPAFFMASKPQYPLFLFEQEIMDKDAKEFHDAGFKFYSCIEYSYFLDLGWVGENTYDYTMLDKVLSGFTRRLPDAYLLPRIHIWAPKWWVEKHPEETIRYAVSPGEYVYRRSEGPAQESFASELWRREAGDALRSLVRHIQKSPYADRIMGIHVAAGLYGEWHAYCPWFMPDTSEPMRRAFIKYLINKYSGNVNKLRAAWGDSRISFEDVNCPTFGERTSGDWGLFHDPARSRKIPDYFEAFHNVTVDAIDYFCRIVKEESSGRLLTCVLYGYQPDMDLPQEIDHRKPARAFHLKNVDMFASPHSYDRRKPGDDASFRHVPESVALQGKIFIDEADERTHLAPQGTICVHAKNLEESVQILRRAFANVITQGCGTWFMDQSSGYWYDHPDIRKDFRKFKKLADQALDLPRERISEVALIDCPESEFYIALQRQMDGPSHQLQLPELSRTGAPFSRYLIDDLEQGLVPDHKVYLFINAFYLAKIQRTSIEQLKTGGKTLIWIYAPGFVSENKLSLENMRELTEIRFLQKFQSFNRIDLDCNQFPFGTSSYPHWDWWHPWTPRFVPMDKDCEVWGRYPDSGEPALVVKKFENWTSVYSPMPGIPWNVLQEIYRNAGVHIYAEQGDNLVANRSWIGLHTITGGKKTIRLPEERYVYDAFNDRLISDRCRAFEVDLKEHQTALFLLLKE